MSGRWNGWRTSAAVTGVVMVVTGLPASLEVGPGGGGAAAEAVEIAPGVPFQHPSVTELPGRRGGSDGVEMIDHGDLDGDEIPDVAVLRHDASSTATATSVLAMLGQGDGTFSPTYAFPVAGAPRNIDGGVVIDEFTGDALPDLASAISSSATILIHPGTGDGSFGTTIPVALSVPAGATNAGPHLLRSADLDADGDDDLVAGFSTGVSLLLSDGVGGFAAPVTVLSDVGLLQDVVLADLGSDGLLDLVLAGKTALQVLTQGLAGGFTQTARVPAPEFYNFGFSAAVVGDFGGDASVDVLGSRGTTDSRDSDGVGILIGAGDGTLTAPAAWVDTPGFRGVARNTNDHVAGDLDADGHADAVFTAGETVVAVFGDGGGGLDVEAWLAGTPDAELGDSFTDLQETSNAVAFDANADDQVDLVAGVDGGVFASINVLLADADSPRTYTAAQVFKQVDMYDDDSSLNLVEFTGDDALDIVSVSKDGPLYVAAGRGDGTFEEPYVADDRGDCYFGYLDQTGDFDGDGNPDVVCHDISPFVYFGDGVGGVRDVQQVVLGDPDTEFHLTTDVLPVDLDLDGRDELVVSAIRSTEAGSYNDDTTRIQVLEWDPLTEGLELEAFVEVAPPRETNKDTSTGLVADDLNGDDNIDITTLFTPNGGTTLERLVILGDGDGGLSAPVRTDTGLPWTFERRSRIGDLDGDTIPDIVSAAATAGGRALVVEIGQGDATFATPAIFTTRDKDGYTGMELVDIDVDGDLDVVMETDRTIEVHRGDGAGNLATPLHLELGTFFSTSVAVGDVDGDALPDIVANGAVGAVVHRTDADVTPQQVNLNVVDVVVPPQSVRPGDDATIDVTVQNTGPTAALGTWIDEVVLETSRGPRVVGTSLVRGPLAPGAQYTATITGAWPAALAGGHDLVVRTDARGTLPESDESDNELRRTVTSVVDSLPFDSDVQQTVAAGRQRVHRIQVDGAAAVLRITAPETVLVATARPGLPGDDQLRPVRAETTLGPGVHHILVAGRADAGDGAAYTLRLTAVQPGILAVTPSRVGQGIATFAIEGAGFESDATVVVRRGGESVPVDAVQRSSSTRITARADFSDTTLGDYDVVVTTGGIAYTLTGGIEVVDIEPGRFEVFVDVPARARLFRTSPVEITVLNAGGLDALAPVVRLDTDRARLGRRGDGAFRTRSLDFLAVADDGSAVLAPGETAHISARFDPDPDVVAGDDMGFTARAYGVDNETPWLWAGAATRLRPEGLPDLVWDAAFADFLTVVGSTAGSFAVSLHDVYAVSDELGLASDRADALVPRMVARAVAARPAGLAGTVRDADGPIVLRDVLAVDQQGGIFPTTTTIDGDYAFHDLRPGPFDLRVRDAVPTTVGFVQVPATKRLDLTVGAAVAVSGRVRLPDGRGAARVAVTIERVGHEGDGAGSAQTDASGAFTVRDLQQGQLRVVARAPGLLPTTTLVAASNPGRFTIPDLVLTEGLPVEGTILDGGASPVGGAQVVGRATDGSATAATVSEADGSYALRGLPAGEIEVTAFVTGTGQGSSTLVLGSPGGTADVTLQPGGAIVGTVLSSAGGQPIAGAMILTDALRGADDRTSAAGTYRVDAVPTGATLVEVRAAGHVPTAVPVTVTSGGETTVNVILPTLGVLEVTVANDGELLPDVPVTATLLGGLGGTARTGDNGVAVLRDLVPGDYVVQAGTTASPDATRAVVTVTSGTTTIDLGAALTRVHGRVTDDGGTAIAEAEVAVLVADEPLLLTSTDTNGAYDVLVEPGSVVTVRAIAPDDRVALVRDLAVATADIDLPLVLGTSSLTVSARGPAGLAEGVDLTLRLAGGGEVVRSRTGTSGAVTFAGVPNGGWSVLAAGPGLAPTVAAGTLAGTTSTEILLPAGRQAAGRVLDAGGASVPGAVVGVVDPGTSENVLATTDNDGLWALTSLSPGVVTLHASDGTDIVEQGVDLTTASVIDIDLTLDGAGASVTGVLTDPSGTPLSGHVIELVRQGLPVGLTTTGTDGAFAIDGVPEGEWTIVAALGGSPSASDSVIVPASGSVVADLVAEPAVGWVVQPPFELGPPGNVTAINASLAPPPSVGRKGRAATGRAGFGEFITGLPRPQKNAWAEANDTAWRANQERANPIDWDCPPVVFSLERQLIESENALSEAFYDLQTSYGAVQQVYTAGMGQALAEGTYTGLKTWVTLSGMAGGGQTTIATGNIGASRFIVTQADQAADALAGLALPIIDLAAGSAGNALFLGDGSVSGADGASTLVGIASGGAGLAQKSVAGGVLGVAGIAYDWNKFRKSLNGINESQLNTLVSFSLTEDRYLAAVQRHQQLTNTFATATGDCEPDPPEEEPEDDEDDGPDDDDKTTGGDDCCDDPIEPPAEEPTPKRPRKPRGPDARDDAKAKGGQAIDPNEIVGPPGVGVPGWIAAPADLGYGISFENQPTASLAATIVTVTTVLDVDTDIATFELGDIGWGPVLVDVPSGLQSWTGTVPLPQTDNVVEVAAGLDLESRTATWTLTTIDPAIDDIPDDPTAGFLPPNDATHVGEGFVDYAVAPAATTTGTEIAAQASIVFDENAPIETNTWVNTIDAARPIANMTALPSTSRGTTLALDWTGDDVGAGAVTYDLFAQVDGSPLFLYAEDLTITAVEVPVVVGSQYGFAVIATDAVGLQEDVLDGAEVTTTVADEIDPTPTPTPSPTMSPTPTPSPTMSPTPTPSPTSSPTATPTPSPTPSVGPTVPEGVRRISGESRIDTAIALSMTTFPTGSSRVTTVAGKSSSPRATTAKIAILARADTYADALAGGPLALALNGPILLTSKDGLSTQTAAELQRLGVEHVILLGGEVALSPQVATDVAALGVRTVERVAGATRFATAAAVATRLGPYEHAYVAQGAAPEPSRGWPDAVAVSALATSQRRPILLVQTDRLPDETAAALAGLASVTIVGGTVSVDQSVEAAIDVIVGDVSRLAGENRYATSDLVATLHASVGGDPQHTWLVTGANWPDALAAGPAAAASGGVLHLVNGSELDPATRAWLESRDPRTVTLVGGPVAIAATVEQAVAAILARRR